jgi:P4 family phage/plasmid primase-like protien
VTTLPLAAWSPEGFRYYIFEGARSRKGVPGWGGWRGLMAWVEKHAAWADNWRTPPQDCQQACFADLDGGGRRNADLRAATAMVLDCDTGIDPASVLAALAEAGAAHAFWETKRSTPEQPRWRVVLPLAAPLPIADANTSAAARTWRAMVAAIERLAGLEARAFDRAGATPAHLWLGPIRLADTDPQRRVQVADGQALDWPTLLALAPDDGGAARARTPADELAEFGEDLRARLVEALVGAWPPSSIRHEAMLALASCLEKKGVPVEEIPAVVFDAARGAGDEEAAERKGAAASAIRNRSPRRRGWPWLKSEVPELADALDRALPSAPPARAGDEPAARDLSDEEADAAAAEALAQPTARGARKPTAGVAMPHDADLEYTDMGNAARLVQRHGHEWRYVPNIGSFFWNGRHWEEDDEEKAVQEFAKETAEAIRVEELPKALRDCATPADVKAKTKALMKHYAKSQSARSLEAMIKVARSDPRILLRARAFDQDRMLFNVSNGTIDLRTGELRPHDPDDYITRIAHVEYRPDATCPTWDQFLDRIMLGRRPLVEFLNRVIGSALSGEIRQHVFYVFYGTGRNGKGTFSRTIQQMMGRYARGADMSTFLEKSFQQSGAAHQEDIYRLRGVRYVTAEEATPGKKIDVGRMKTMTGGDLLVARKPHGRSSIEFFPEFTLAIAVNHKPHIPAADIGTWSRIKLVPFDAKIEQWEIDQDPTFEARLHAELPGVLAWAVRGCLDWQSQGLAEPAEVRAATQEYQQATNPLLRFVDERCVRGADLWTSVTGLYNEYEAWCKDNDEEPLPKCGAFATRLEELDFKPRRLAKGTARIRQGLALRNSPEGIAALAAAEAARTAAEAPAAEAETQAASDGGQEGVTQGVTREESETTAFCSRGDTPDASEGYCSPNAHARRDRVGSLQELPPLFSAPGASGCHPPTAMRTPWGDTLENPASSGVSPQRVSAPSCYAIGPPSGTAGEEEQEEF